MQTNAFKTMKDQLIGLVHCWLFVTVNDIPAIISY